MTLDMECSQLTPDERLAEKNRIIMILETQGPSWDAYSQKEEEFLDQMKMALTVSPKQLAWLRAIKDKML